MFPVIGPVNLSWQMNNMQRINLITPVRTALLNSGYSSVKVVAAINSALGELKVAKSTERLGDGSMSRKGKYGVTNVVSEKYEGKYSMPLLFDAWHSKLASAHKVAEFDGIDLPAVFSEWLDKMKVVTPVPMQQPESNPVPA